MKSLLTSLVVLLGSVSASLAASEQNAGQSTNKMPPPPPAIEKMSPELRARFEAARAKAMEDPEVQKAMAGQTSPQEKRKIMRKAIVKIDPGLKDELPKPKNVGGKPPGDKKGGKKAGFETLDDAEKEKLMAARKAAKKDPAVQAARKTMDSAETPEARQEASAAYRKAMADAVIKADPSLEPALKKLEGKAAGAN